MTAPAQVSGACRVAVGPRLQAIADDVREVAADRVRLADAVVAPPARRMGQVAPDAFDVWLAAVLYHRHHAQDEVLVRDMLAGRSDARGIPDWEDAATARALAVADGGRLRAEPGWAVADAAGADVVVDDGRLRLVARPEQVVLSGTGRTCSLLLPVARHYLQSGWFHTSGLRGAPAGARPGARVYLTPSRAVAPALLGSLVRRLDDEGVRFGLKTGNCGDTFRRADPMVLYAERASLHRVLGAVGAVLAEVSGGLESRTPGFAERLAPGVAVACEPSGTPGHRPSLGQHRALTAARAILSSTASGPPVVDLLHDAFLAAGIDPARPAWEHADAPARESLLEALDA